MIYPTEMTLATGTTVYAGDPDSDECIASREVRVSVTYRIEEEEDFDLADFARAKAADVERARVAAQDRIQEGIQERIAAHGRIERCRTDTSEAAFGPREEAFDPSDPAWEPPDAEPPDEDGVVPDPFPEEADYMSARCGLNLNGVYAQNGGHSGHGMYARNGVSTLPSVPSVGVERLTEIETDWAIKPQVLALGSHFRRLGLSPEDQTALLRARFGKFRLERLTKDEAAGLMRYLERGEWESTEPAALAH
ncbi:MAG: hypothetical protein M3Y28_07360 [Armatimonadota bacterium]|nr:hypothetical protein [Armatimonadota bacterium]